jgi:hypothetical protein
MDRQDERRDSRIEEDVTESRQGDILGLGGSTIPKTPGDPSASDDPESVRRRRERAMSPDSDPHVEREDPYKQGKGATGIDMGAGGRGTDIEPE